MNRLLVIGVGRAALAAFGLATLVAHGTAQQSPELALIVDESGAKVARYDTNTGTYFGSFGSGYLVDPIGVTVRGDTAYVADDISSSYSTIKKFNWSTGQYMGTLFSGAPYMYRGVEFDPQGFLVAGDYGVANRLWRMDPSNGSTQGINLSGTPQFTAEDVDFNGSTAYVASYSSGSGGLRTYSVSGGTTYTLQHEELLGEDYYGVAFQTTGQGSFAYVAGHGAGGAVLRQFYSSGFNDYSASYGAPGSYLTGIGFGHFGMGFVNGFDASSVSHVWRFDANSNSIAPIGSFTTPQVVSPRGMAIVAMPEPASAIVILAGLAAMGARRRRT